MADDMNYKKMAEAIENGIALGIRKVVHQGLWIDGQKVSLTPPETRSGALMSDEELKRVVADAQARQAAGLIRGEGLVGN